MLTVITENLSHRVSLLFILFFPVSAAGLGAKPYYHQNADRLFWFMLISDTHIGAEGAQDTKFLAWATREARDVINPQFIVNTGDLTDSTDGGIIPNGPYEDEWNANHYTVMAIDGNGLAVTPADKDQWPVVLITAPMDRCLGECPNTFAYEVPRAYANLVRALVFDKNPITTVQFRIDGSTT